MPHSSISYFLILLLTMLLFVTVARPEPWMKSSPYLGHQLRALGAPQPLNIDCLLLP